MKENGYPHIQTAADYREYARDVQRFLQDFEGEPSTGFWSCPECGADGDRFDNCDGCKECDCDLECWSEPGFSWSPCDCCGRSLGGDREHVIGWIKGARENDYAERYQWEGSVCSDCLYYFCYGRLDDMTMMDIDDDANDWEDQLNALRNAYRLADDGDQWGTVMLALLDCAEWLSIWGEEVPEHWEFRPSSLRGNPEFPPEYSGFGVAIGFDSEESICTIEPDAVRAFGERLMRLRGIHLAAGRDY